MDLSIIILSYKSKNDLAVLLPSIFESRGIDFLSALPQPDPAFMKQDEHKYSVEVIIVDNGSNDGTAEFVENYYRRFLCGRTKTSDGDSLRFVQNINNGFAAGNNLGIGRASGKYILLLNPDTKLQPDTLATMMDFMESRPDVGISGCKLIKGDGKLDLACRRRFPNPANSFKRLFLLDRKNYNYTDIDENQSMEVDSVVGAFLLIRKSLIDKIGPLDDSFFMYGEDLDWCWRCKAAGFKVWYYPKTFIYHYKGQSSKKAPYKTLKAFHDAMWIFYQKYYSQDNVWLFNGLVWLGIYGRLSVLGFVNLFKKYPEAGA